MVLHKDAENTMNWSSLKENGNKKCDLLRIRKKHYIFGRLMRKNDLKNLTHTGHFVVKKQIVKQ